MTMVSSKTNCRKHRTENESGVCPASGVDWAGVWRRRLASNGLEANLERNAVNEEAFWSVYQRWQDVLKRSGYPGEALNRVLGLVEGGDSVLDIGAGSGTYTLPLARKAEMVTAVEPSGVQAESLGEDAARAGLANIRVVRQKWQRVKLSRIGRHDVVLAAYCFQMPQIKPALEKMIASAARKLVLIHSAGNDLKPVLEKLFGIQPAPDYTCLYNLLCQMGWRPAAEVLTRHYKIELDVQMEMLGYNPGLTQQQLDELKEYLSRAGWLRNERGQFWLEREHRDGLILLDVQKDRLE